MKKLIINVFLAFLLILSSSHFVWAQGKELILRVDGLACPFCAYGLEKKITKMEGVLSFDADLEKGEVYVTLNDQANIDISSINKAVKESGFTLRAIFLKTGDKIEELEFSNK